VFAPRDPALEDVRPDEALMRAVQGGDSRAFEGIYDRYHRLLFSFFVRLTGERPGSEDLVQDVFVRVLRYRASYDPGRPFRAWIYQLARNAASDRRQSRAAHHGADALPDDVRDPGPTPLARVVGDERRALVERGLGALPDEAREAIVLSRVEGLSHREVGRILGCTEAAARVRVFRAVQQLRSAVERLQRPRG